MGMIHVDGKKMGRILLYALSTCVLVPEELKTAPR